MRRPVYSFNLPGGDQEYFSQSSSIGRRGAIWPRLAVSWDRQVSTWQYDYVMQRSETPKSQQAITGNDDTLAIPASFQDGSTVSGGFTARETHLALA